MSYCPQVGLASAADPIPFFHGFSNLFLTPTSSTYPVQFGRDRRSLFRGLIRCAWRFWVPKSTNIGPKRHSNIDHFFISFLMDFRSQNRPKNGSKIYQKSIQNLSRRPSWKGLGGSWRGLGGSWGALGGLLGVSWGYLGSKSQQVTEKLIRWTPPGPPRWSHVGGFWSWSHFCT